MQRVPSVALVRTIISLGTSRDVSFLAGAVAFFGFLSLIPSVLLAVTVGSLVGGEQFAMRVVDVVGSYLSAEGSDILTSALTDAGGLARVSLVGGVLLFWSALKVFRAIDIAFDRVYEQQGTTPLLEQIINGTIVIGVITVGGSVLLVTELVIDRVAGGMVSMVALWVLLLSGLIVVLLPLYYILPPIRRPIMEVLPGTFTAVIGLLVLRQTFQFYAVRAGQYEAYGAVGAVLLFLLWLYFGSMILVFGAVVNAAVAKQETRGQAVSSSHGVDH